MPSVASRIDFAKQLTSENGWGLEAGARKEAEEAISAMPKHPHSNPNRKHLLRESLNSMRGGLASPRPLPTSGGREFLVVSGLQPPVPSPSLPDRSFLLLQRIGREVERVEE